MGSWQGVAARLCEIALMSNYKVDLSYIPSPFSLGNKLARVVWGFVWLLIFRPNPRPFHGWRRMLLRLIGICKEIHSC